MKKFFILLVVTGLTVACSKTTESGAKTQIEQSSETQKANEKTLLVNTQLSDEKKIKNLSHINQIKDKKVVLNGEFFKVENPQQLVKGDKVFNVAMGQYGTVKGSLVIVTKIDTSALISDSHLEKIAANTYRIIPKDKSQLFLLYQRLQSNDEIEIVELEIDYSGRNAPVTQ